MRAVGTEMYLWNWSVKKNGQEVSPVDNTDNDVEDATDGAPNMGDTVTDMVVAVLVAAAFEVPRE